MKRPKTITNEQAKDLGYWLDGRFKIIFELGVETGLRISDILALRVKDVQKNPLTVWEKKTKRHRTVKISENLHKSLLFLTALENKDSYAFKSRRNFNVALHRSTVHRQIKAALKWLKFDASAHSARKLYAQNIYAETGSVEKVQKALHHIKRSTTLTYLDIDQPEITELKKSETKKPSFITEIIRRLKNVIAKTRD